MEEEDAAREQGTQVGMLDDDPSGREPEQARRSGSGGGYAWLDQHTGKRKKKPILKF